ncbi:hypothetical protein [Adlercreutzia sp. ZJ141]|uniref:hypothetical protein n=1 Tax=Adlercreutzia sp. ZJ141 TaxID=2709406 RepID=UPI0013EADEF9|nr:hypothetical protein [Adlercreutzia sp. ZJ141]
MGIAESSLSARFEDPKERIVVVDVMTKVIKAKLCARLRACVYKLLVEEFDK